MAWEASDVEAWLDVDEGSLDSTILDRVIASVSSHAAQFYDLTDPTDQHDQALIMASANLWRLQHGPGGWSGSDERGAVASAFDSSVTELLADRLITAGIFGPSANVVEAE